MTQKPPTNVRAMNAEVGRRLGHGQDNMVNNLILHDDARLPSFVDMPPGVREMRESGDWVVKVSHRASSAKKRRDATLSPAAAAESGTAYKKNKYDILKHFLGDFVPDSMFFVSTVQEPNGKLRPAEITVQRKVPNTRLDQLNAEKQSSPILHSNLLTLMKRLQYMYSVIGEVNARTSGGINLDAKLDLGGVSDFVQSHALDYEFTPEDAAVTAVKIGSPNLLVDPDTLDVYCIDYDQGDWTDGMDQAKSFAYEIDTHRKAKDLAQVAIVPQFGRRSTDIPA